MTFKPTVENAMKGDEAARMQKLLDALEAIDDVQEVYTTAVIDGGECRGRVSGARMRRARSRSRRVRSGG